MTSTLSPDHRRELERLRDQIADVSATVDRLLAGPSQIEPGVISLFRTDAIIWTLDHDGVPMSPAQITRRLHEFGRNDPANEVQTSTFDVWKQGRITKLARGVYCSNAHIPAGAPRFVPDPPSNT